MSKYEVHLAKGGFYDIYERLENGTLRTAWIEDKDGVEILWPKFKTKNEAEHFLINTLKNINKDVRI